MAKEQKWVLLNADDSVAAQLIIAGRATPTESGDNPTGLREFKVGRHGDLVHERFSPGTKRWSSDKERLRRAERRARLRDMHRDELADEIAEEVAERLRAEMDALLARVAALEAKDARRAE